MARIPEKNKRFRSKEQIASDVAFVLNAPLSHGTKFAVLKDVSWVWTEFNGKYRGCEWWSQGAILQFAADRKSKRLRHEHAVPRHVVFEMLFGLEHPTAEQVQAICEKFFIGVVVIIEEHDVLNVEYSKSMPPEFFDADSPEFHDPWLRYKRCNLRVIRHCRT